MSKSLIIVILCSFNLSSYKSKIAISKGSSDKYILVLGITQDAGYPQAGCNVKCCAAYWNGKEPKKYVTSLAIVDGAAQKF